MFYLPLFVAELQIEVHQIAVVTLIKRRDIGDADCLISPFQYMGVEVAILHHLLFPQRAIVDGGRVPCILLRKQNFISSFIGSKNHT